MFAGYGYYEEVKPDFIASSKYMPYLSIIDELKTVGIHTGDVYPAFREGGAKDFDEFLSQIKAFINLNNEQDGLYKAAALEPQFNTFKIENTLLIDNGDHRLSISTIEIT